MDFGYDAGTTTVPGRRECRGFEPVSFHVKRKTMECSICRPRRARGRTATPDARFKSLAALPN